MKQPRILFCLKFREGYWGAIGSDLSSGLKNSVTFIVQMLTDMGYDARVVQLTDNNAIDKAIHDYRPDWVILEALWVVPDKLDVLQAKWPHVRWFVRNHSNAAFIANEGIAMEWFYGYLSRGVTLLNNDPSAVNDFQTMAWSYGGQEFYDLIEYAPNYYPLDDRPPHVELHRGDNTFDIGCFGAIRPLKSHLAQAIACLQFCMQSRRYLRFHINSTRVEQIGEPILRNLRSLFSHTKHAELVEHPWMEHDAFLPIVAQCDFGMCVSFSETFCIVAADFASQGVPVICSPEVPWIGEFAQIDPTDTAGMVWALMRAEAHRRNWANEQWEDLQEYNERTVRAWHRLLRADRFD